VSNIWNILHAAGFYWMDGTVRSFEGVGVKGWMRGAWARGPIAKTGALRGRHLFTVCRVEHFSPRYTFLARIETIIFDKQISFRSPVLENICETERSKLISDHHFLNNESANSDSFARYST